MTVDPLTGKYDREYLPRGNRNFGGVKWSKLDPIVDELKRIGENEGKPLLLLLP